MKNFAAFFLTKQDLLILVLVMITYWILSQDSLKGLKDLETLKTGSLKQLVELFELLESNVIFDSLIAVKNLKTLCALFVRSANDIDYVPELHKLFARKDGIMEGDMLQLSKLDLSSDELDLSYGTEFQQQVWREIAKIPYGETCTYSELAVAIGKPNAFRAVANACGANNLAVIVPCHRVLHKNSNNNNNNNNDNHNNHNNHNHNKSGYRWGSRVKLAILAHERN